MSEPRGSLAQRLSAVGVLELLSVVVAAVGLVFAALNLALAYGVMVGIAIALVVGDAAHHRLSKRGLSPIEEGVLARASVVAAIAVDGITGDSLISLIIAAALLVLLGAEVAAERTSRAAMPFAVNVPGLQVRDAPIVSVAPVYWITVASLPLAAASILGMVFAWITVAGIVVAGSFASVAIVDGILRLRLRRRADSRLRAALTTFAPVFAVHWDAEPGTGYQLEMWLPYLDRLEERYVLIVRNERTFAEAARLTGRPTVLRVSTEDLDAIVLPSMRAVFYVNNAARNTNMVRFPGLTHIQLNHGDSDKTPSYNPVSRMYDKNFVAGRAAIDRFTAHGVRTSPGFFAIVGRPQVEPIWIGERPERREDGSRVLYAPTWAGFNSDSHYSSLLVGVPIVSALLELDTAVIFRPHPYTDRSPVLRREATRIREILAEDTRRTGRLHVWGAAAESMVSLYDCFNMVDALITDISSVVSDFLYSTKPFVVVAMNGTADELETELPIAKAGYPLSRDLSNLDDVLRSILIADEHIAVRMQMRDYYLGEFPGADYANVFVRTAREQLGLM